MRPFNERYRRYKPRKTRGTYFSRSAINPCPSPPFDGFAEYNGRVLSLRMNGRRFALLVLGLVIGASPLRAQNQMAPFSMDHRRAALAHSPVDVSFLLNGPAGKNGFVKVQNGHLATGDGQ